MLGEELPLDKLPRASQELALATSQILRGKTVYFVGPGPGKTALLRALSVSLYKAGYNPIYIKLEYIKYNWKIKNYIEKYFKEHMELVGHEPREDFDMAIIDDGELALEYPSPYKALLAEVAGRIRAAASRLEDLEALERLFGPGLPIRVDPEGEPGGVGRRKMLFGLAFIGSVVEVEVI